MSKPFEMTWGSNNQDSLGAQIKEYETAEFEVEDMDKTEFAETFCEKKKVESEDK